MNVGIVVVRIRFFEPLEGGDGINIDGEEIVRPSTSGGWVSRSLKLWVSKVRLVGRGLMMRTALGKRDLRSCFGRGLIMRTMEFESETASDIVVSFKEEEGDSGVLVLYVVPEDNVCSASATSRSSLSTSRSMSTHEDITDSLDSGRVEETTGSDSQEAESVISRESMRYANLYFDLGG